VIQRSTKKRDVNTTIIRWAPSENYRPDLRKLSLSGGAFLIAWMILFAPPARRPSERPNVTRGGWPLLGRRRLHIILRCCSWQEAGYLNTVGQRSCILFSLIFRWPWRLWFMIGRVSFRSCLSMFFFPPRSTRERSQSGFGRLPLSRGTHSFEIFNGHTHKNPMALGVVGIMLNLGQAARTRRVEGLWTSPSCAGLGR